MLESRWRLPILVFVAGSIVPAVSMLLAEWDVPGRSDAVSESEDEEETPDARAPVSDHTPKGAATGIRSPNRPGARPLRSRPELAHAPPRAPFNVASPTHEAPTHAPTHEAPTHEAPTPVAPPPERRVETKEMTDRVVERFQFAVRDAGAAGAPEEDAGLEAVGPQ